MKDAESLDQGPGPAELDVCVRSASSRFSYRDVSLCIDMQLRWRAVGRVDGEEDQLPGRVGIEAIIEEPFIRYATEDAWVGGSWLRPDPKTAVVGSMSLAWAEAKKGCRRHSANR